MSDSQSKGEDIYSYQKTDNYVEQHESGKGASRFFSRFGYNVLDHRAEMGLTWDEIAVLAKDPICYYRWLILLTIIIFVI